jgi:sugar transferase (PEP-CTERM/EpsH1 system associated)
MPTQVQRENRSTVLSLTASIPERTDRIRVLHVVSFLGMGGTEHGVLKVMGGLGAEQFEHRICAVRGIDPNFVGRMGIAKQACTVGGTRAGFQFPFFRLVRLMREYRPHIVHSRNFGALDAIPAARLARVPVAIHSEHGYEIETLSGLPLRRRILCRAFYPIADAVFTVTRDLRTYHAKQSWLDARKFQVIHNGVDTDRFALGSQTAGKIRNELEIPQSRIVIGTTGRLVPIKDHRTLLRAANDLLRLGKDVHVLIVGSGPELTMLREYVAATPQLSGRVTFSGPSDRVPEFLSAMDVFVLPSICEGMSNTILEAMASSLPVVVTHVGGNPELVEDGRSGWLFPPRDSSTLARLLGRLVDDAALRVQFGKEARRRAVDQFSLEGMIQHYRDLYLELASRRGMWKRG